MDFAYTLDPILLIILLFVVIEASAEGGFELGRWIAKRHQLREAELFGVVEGGVLGLVGLMLAFSFSLALGRYEDRQHLVVLEANAIDATYLRSSFLPSAERQSFRNELREYARTRVVYYEQFRFEPARAKLAAKSSALQSALWDGTAAAATRAPRDLTSSLLVEALNNMIDMSRERDAALLNRVPAEIGLLLVVVSAVAAALLGYGFGLNDRRRTVMTTVFVLLMTMIVFTIFDLDRPQSGYIRINLNPLRAVADAIR